MTDIFLKKKLLEVANKYGVFIDIEYFDDSTDTIYLIIKFPKLVYYNMFIKELSRYGLIVREKLVDVGKAEVVFKLLQYF